MKAMCKLGVVFLVVAGAASCDSTRRDFSQCDQTYNACLKGFVCDLSQGLCVLNNGQADAAIVSVDATPMDTAIVADAADAPAVEVAQTDAPPALDVAADAAVDVAQPADLAAPDLSVPDAQGTCSVDNDCVGVAGGAFCVAAKCVSCNTNGQCNNDAGVPICSAQNVCVSCATAVVDGGAGCPASAPLCEPNSGRCVLCLQNSDCPTAGKAFCVQNQCVGCDSVPAGTGGTDAGASSDGGSTDGGAAGTGPCTGSTPVCATSANTTNAAIVGQCVGCASNADCSGSTPICSAANTCTACTSDTQCTRRSRRVHVPPRWKMRKRCRDDLCAESIWVRWRRWYGGVALLSIARCSHSCDCQQTPHCDERPDSVPDHFNDDYFERPNHDHRSKWCNHRRRGICRNSRYSGGRVHSWSHDFEW